MFGVSEPIAFRFNAGIAAMTVVAIYLLVFTVFADRTAAFFAALVMALMPEQTAVDRDGSRRTVGIVGVRDRHALCRGVSSVEAHHWRWRRPPWRPLMPCSFALSRR